MVLISCDIQAHLKTLVLIFNNADNDHPIRGLTDDISRVVYRVPAISLGWMREIFLNCLARKEFLYRFRNRRELVFCTDNLSNPNAMKDVRRVLDERNIEVRFFPYNNTHHLHSADIFQIWNLKKHWRHQWDDLEMTISQQEIRMRSPKSSGKLSNSGNRHFLKFAAKSVCAVNMQIYFNCKVVTDKVWSGSKPEWMLAGALTDLWVADNNCQV